MRLHIALLPVILCKEPWTACLGGKNTIANFPVRIPAILYFLDKGESD